MPSTARLTPSCVSATVRSRAGPYHFPAAFLSVTVLAVNLLGDRLRDALDLRTANGLNAL
jgi:ABC-type dipeptide/oligopeptide/nickel transport system permease subunit